MPDTAWSRWRNPVACAPRLALTVSQHGGEATGRISNAFVVVGAIAFTSTPMAAYGQCVMFDKPEDLFANSDAVFVGTVLRNAPTGAQGSHAIVDVATLRLDRSWKGVRG